MWPVALLALLVVTACGGPDDETPRADVLDLLGQKATTGAAAGYVDDAGCAHCHADQYQSFQAVGMANSLARPANSSRIEDFGQDDYFHAASGRFYWMEQRGEELWFHRHRLDAHGERVDQIEIRVDWVLGSGNRARSYLYRTPAGNLYQLPIGWYSEEGVWAMSPGFERAGHDGIERRVRRECMFCHNAYPEVPAGSDRHDQPHLFPEQLPEGIGCQRCHGPGAEHVRSVLEGESRETIQAAIANPGRWPWELRNQVCYQCHLQPAVEITGVRRMGRNDYSFRPGEMLHDYLLHVDIDEVDRSLEERFQINHHAWRLQQSPCFIASEGQMGCLTCHDPHVKVEAQRRQVHYRERCVGCHRDAETAHPEWVEATHGDCVSCHMPRRRTQDVIHVTMTDHWITRGPADFNALLAPLNPRDPVIAGLRILNPEALEEGPEFHLEYPAYQALAALKAGIPGALEQLRTSVMSMARPDPGWYYELARFQLTHGRYQAALPVIEALRDSGAYPSWRGMKGLALLGLGRQAEALEVFEKILSEKIPVNPVFQPEDYYNAGLAFRASGELERALEMFESALEQRPIMVPAWYQLGQAALQAGDRERARVAFVQALKINPDAQRARLALDRLAEIE